MDRFNIFIVPMTGGRAFEDVAELLQLSLRSLGRDCRIGPALDAGAVNIVLGYPGLAGPQALAGYRYIVYQLEQLPGQSWDLVRLTPERLAILQGAEAVWDFSPRNIAWLAEQGLEGVRHLPFGFHPGMERVVDEAPEIDVLFYGVVNLRRKAVLDQLACACRVKTIFGAYGERRDRLISRARIVLNLRVSPDTSIMEQARLTYLLSNGRFAVSEDAEDNPYGDALAAAPYERLAETCLRYLADDEGRLDMARRGRAFLEARPMTSLVRAVL